MVKSNTDPIPSLSPSEASPPPPQPPMGAPDIETSDNALRAETLLRSLYNELRQMAGQMMAGQSPSNTLQATALVHEAWIKLGNGGNQVWAGQSHFLASATQAMRHILIDRARRKLRQRHGSGQPSVSLDDIDVAATDRPESVLRINSALDQLALVGPDQARLVELRYFCGLNIQEAAAVLGISPATAKRQLTFARAWLFHHLKSDQ